jgi:hypothetical protein
LPSESLSALAGFKAQASQNKNGEKLVSGRESERFLAWRLGFLVNSFSGRLTDGRAKIRNVAFVLVELLGIWEKSPKILKRNTRNALKRCPKVIGEGIAKESPERESTLPEQVEESF